MISRVARSNLLQNTYNIYPLGFYRLDDKWKLVPFLNIDYDFGVTRRPKSRIPRAFQLVIYFKRKVRSR